MDLPKSRLYKAILKELRAINVKDEADELKYKIENSHEEEMEAKRNLQPDYASLKYDLSELYNNIPVFAFPMMSFEDKKTWETFTNKVLSPYKLD